MDRQPDDPPSVQCFRNVVDGRVVKSDPKVLADALPERGTRLVGFEIW